MSRWHARRTWMHSRRPCLGRGSTETVGVADVAQAARAAPRRHGDAPRAADLLLDALVTLADDYDAAVPRCRKALEKLCGGQISPEERLRWFWQGCVVALEVWDDESAYVLSQHARSDRPRDRHAQRVGACPQRSRAGACVLRRVLRRRLNSRRSQVRRGRQRHHGGTVRSVDPRGLAGPGRRSDES